MNKLSYFIFVLIFVISCSDEQEENFKRTSINLNNQFINNEHLEGVDKINDVEVFSIKKIINNIHYQVDLIPYQYKFLIDYDSLTAFNKQDYEQYKKLIFFSVKIGLDSKMDILKSDLNQMEYEDLIKYISFKIEKDFYVETGLGNIHPELLVFERTFGVKPFILLNLVFDGNKIGDSKKLVYNDKLFNLGIIKTNFTNKVIFNEAI